MGDDNFDVLLFMVWTLGIMSAFILICTAIINTHGMILVIAGIGIVFRIIIKCISRVIAIFKKRKKKHYGENSGTEKTN